jgi:mediator of RNA polymerase II transcription subunit 14
MEMQDADDLDFESVLRKVIRKHAKAILTMFQRLLQTGPLQTVFSAPGAVTFLVEGGVFSILSVEQSTDFHIT